MDPMDNRSSFTDQLIDLLNFRSPHTADLLKTDLVDQTHLGSLPSAAFIALRNNFRRYSQRVELHSTLMKELQMYLDPNAGLSEDAQTKLRNSLSRSETTKPLHAAMLSALLLDAILMFGAETEEDDCDHEEAVESYLMPSDPGAPAQLNVAKVLGPPTAETRIRPQSSRVTQAINAPNLAAVVQDALSSLDHVAHNLAKKKVEFVVPTTSNEIQSSTYIAGFLRGRGTRKRNPDLGHRRHFNLVHLVLVANLLYTGVDIEDTEEVKRGLQIYHNKLGMNISFSDADKNTDKLVVDLDITGPLALCLGTSIISILNDERRFSNNSLATTVCVYDLQNVLEYRSHPESLVWKLERAIFRHIQWYFEGNTGRSHPAMLMGRLENDVKFQNLKSILETLLDRGLLPDKERDAWYMLSDMPSWTDFDGELNEHGKRVPGADSSGGPAKRPRLEGDTHASTDEAPNAPVEAQTFTVANHPPLADSPEGGRRRQQAEEEERLKEEERRKEEDRLKQEEERVRQEERLKVEEAKEHQKMETERKNRRRESVRRERTRRRWPPLKSRSCGSVGDSSKRQSKGHSRRNRSVKLVSRQDYSLLWTLKCPTTTLHPP
ncbi:hypothetical protein C8F01DRAFT_546665 [Mycena amicta]|nr:hypothetical protein C8F01DRAFT_546665 [Mycena amicta]